MLWKLQSQHLADQAERKDIHGRLRVLPKPVRAAPIDFASWPTYTS